MTELEHIEIEGFKGLEHVEFEPTDINLITGRNNTGKTSFLEAIDLLFNHSNIFNFSDNFDKIINTYFQQLESPARVSGDEINMEIKYPDEEKAHEYFILALTELISSATQWHVDKGTGPIVGRNDPPKWVDENAFNSSFLKVATQIITEENISDLSNKCIVLEINGNTYPCVNFGRTQHKILSKSLARLEEIIQEEHKEAELAESSLGKFKIEEPSAEAYITLRPDTVSSKCVSIRDIPTQHNRELTTLWESVSDLQNIDKENNSIKIDDIGDYLRHAGFVDNLKTFTLDHLIFEENDEKHDIPYEFMGDGFKAMVGLLWELMDDDIEDQIVLIEEPENHMHPGYVLKLVHFLIDLAQDENVQFFITTHDHDFIRDFFADMPEEKRDYLEDEFSLVRMDDFGVEVLDYETAEHDLKDLHLDLRGI